jgi:hypothetical protein
MATSVMAVTWTAEGNVAKVNHSISPQFIDRIFEANCAPEHGRHIPNDGRQNANGKNGNKEGEPTIQIVRWGNEGKKQFPKEGNIVERLLLGTQWTICTIIK